MKYIMKKQYQLLFVLILGIGIGWFGSVLRFGLPLFSSGKQNNEVSFLKEINLSAEQVERIKKIHSIHSEKMKGSEARLQSAHRTFDELIQASKELTLIKTSYEEIIAARREMDWARFYLLMDVVDVLTPEQQHLVKLPQPGPKR